MLQDVRSNRLSSCQAKVLQGMDSGDLGGRHSLNTEHSRRRSLWPPRQLRRLSNFQRRSELISFRVDRLPVIQLGFGVPVRVVSGDSVSLPISMHKMTKQKDCLATARALDSHPSFFPGGCLCFGAFKGKPKDKPTIVGGRERGAEQKTHSYLLSFTLAKGL